MLTRLVPTQEQIDDLRSQFLQKYNDEPSKDEFHPFDIQHAKESNAWLYRFLEHTDLNVKEALKMMWETCKWRKKFGTNDISEETVNMEYLKVGLVFARNCDVDGKRLLIFKSKLHQRGVRDMSELIRMFVYWMERLMRETDHDLITIFFDMGDTGLSNLDLEYTRSFINICKSYYPSPFNYILVFEQPWILNAAFKIIKGLLPPKAVAVMKFLNSKTIHDYIDMNNMLICWGGNDDYEYVFEPEKRNKPIDSTHLNGNGHIVSGTPPTISKKVQFALSPPDTPMSEVAGQIPSYNDSGEECMLKIIQKEGIEFGYTTSGKELCGNVDIMNCHSKAITFKIKTTSPEKYRVRPSSGVLMPTIQQTIQVVMHGEHPTSTVGKDKFLILCMELKDSDPEPSAKELAELWKVTPPHSGQVEQHRLRCNFPVGDSSDGFDEHSSYRHANSSDTPNDQMAKIRMTLNKLIEDNQKMSATISFGQTLQWITLFIFVVTMSAVVFILKSEFKNDSSVCTNN